MYLYNSTKRQQNVISGSLCFSHSKYVSDHSIFNLKLLSLTNNCCKRELCKVATIACSLFGPPIKDLFHYLLQHLLTLPQTNVTGKQSCQTSLRILLFYIKKHFAWISEKCNIKQMSLSYSSLLNKHCTQ